MILARIFLPRTPGGKIYRRTYFSDMPLNYLESIGAKIENVDVTIICELPRIGPHRNAMREQVAKCLSIDPGRVNIKGKTTEKLGFLGREEGIAAQAIATIKIG